MKASADEGRRERKKRARRTRIYEAARQLFLENGVAATTVEQIAEAADVAQTTFFNHFQSKSAVLRELAGEVSENIHVLLEQELATPGTAEKRIRRFTVNVIRGLNRADALARDVLFEMLRTASGPGRALPYLSQVHERFTAVLSQGQHEGNVRTDLEPELLAELVVGILNAALVGWLDDPTYPFAKRLSGFVDVIAELIQPRPRPRPRS